MDTVSTTERSNTYSNLAVTLIVTELKTKPFFPALRAPTIDAF